MSIILNISIKFDRMHFSVYFIRAMTVETFYSFHPVYCGLDHFHLNTRLTVLHPFSLMFRPTMKKMQNAINAGKTACIRSDFIKVILDPESIFCSLDLPCGPERQL